MIIDLFKRKKEKIEMSFAFISSPPRKPSKYLANKNLFELKA
jgi:hypothetical protein